eukprot:scaffold6319_cov107-Isochrysis_galbana.AAC.6
MLLTRGVRVPSDIVETPRLVQATEPQGHICDFGHGCSQVKRAGSPVPLCSLSETTAERMLMVSLRFGHGQAWDCAVRRTSGCSSSRGRFDDGGTARKSPVRADA